MMTTVLRDEDISFPPTTNQFSSDSHPILKDLTLEGILAALKEQSQTAAADFQPYMSWMHSMVLTTAWTMESASVRQGLE